MELVLDPLDCEPFYHEYGPSCKDKKLVFASWKLPVIGINGTEGNLKFYITMGNDPLLLGNHVVALSNLLGSENIIDIPPNTLGISNERLVLPTYTVGEDLELRTYLHIVPSRCSQLSTFFSSIASFNSTQIESDDDIGQEHSKLHNAKHARMFAVKLHSFTHLTPKDMKMVCKRAGILTSILGQALESVYEKCTSCKIVVSAPGRGHGKEIAMTLRGSMTHGGTTCTMVN